MLGFQKSKMQKSYGFKNRKCKKVRVSKNENAKKLGFQKSKMQKS